MQRIIRFIFPFLKGKVESAGIQDGEKRANSKTERAYCRQKKRQPVLAEDDGIWLLRSCSFACADQPDHAGSIFFGGREPCVIKAAEIRRHRSDEQRYMEGLESYTSDQFIFRDLWIKLKVQCDLLTGKRELNGVYLGKDKYLMQAISEPDQEHVKENIKG